MLSFGDKGALAPPEDGERLFHVGVKLVLPLGELRPVAQNLLCRQPPVLCDGGKTQVKVRCFFIHVYHSGKDVPPTHLLLHKSYRFGEVGLYFFLASACEELRAGGNQRVHKHSAVLPDTAPRRLDSSVNFLSVLLRRLNNVKIVLAFTDVNIGIAGILLLCALVVGFQCPCRPRLVFGEA